MESEELLDLQPLKEHGKLNTEYKARIVHKFEYAVGNTADYAVHQALGGVGEVCSDLRCETNTAKEVHHNVFPTREGKISRQSDHDKWLEVQLGSQMHTDAKPKRNSFLHKQTSKRKLDVDIGNQEDTPYLQMRSRSSSGNRSSGARASKLYNTRTSISLEKSPSQRAATAGRATRESLQSEPKYHVFSISTDVLPTSQTPAETSQRFGIYNKVIQDGRRRKSSKKGTAQPLHPKMHAEQQMLPKSEITTWGDLLELLRRNPIDSSFLQEIESLAYEQLSQPHNQVQSQMQVQIPDRVQNQVQVNVGDTKEQSPREIVSSSYQESKDDFTYYKRMSNDMNTSRQPGYSILNPDDIDQLIQEAAEKQKKKNKHKGEKSYKKQTVSVKPDDGLHEWKSSPQSVKEFQFSPITQPSPTNFKNQRIYSDSDSSSSSDDITSMSYTFRRKNDKVKSSDINVNSVLSEIQDLLSSIYFPLLNGVKHDRALLTDIITKMNKLAPSIRKRMLQELQKQSKAELDAHELEAKLLQSNYKLEKANEQLQQLKKEQSKYQTPTKAKKKVQNKTPKSISGPLGEFQNKQLRLQQLQSKIKEHSKQLLEAKCELLQLTDVSTSSNPSSKKTTKHNFDSNVANIQGSSEINEKLIESQIKMKEMIEQKDEEINLLRSTVQQFEDHLQLKVKTLPNLLQQHDQRAIEEHVMRTSQSNIRNNISTQSSLQRFNTPTNKSHEMAQNLQGPVSTALFSTYSHINQPAATHSQHTSAHTTTSAIPHSEYPKSLEPVSEKKPEQRRMSSKLVRPKTGGFNVEDSGAINTSNQTIHHNTTTADHKGLRVPVVKQITPFNEEIPINTQRPLFQAFSPIPSKPKKKQFRRTSYVGTLIDVSESTNHERVSSDDDIIQTFSNNATRKQKRG